jgi:Flp pilus assembly protein TadG
MHMMKIIKDKKGVGFVEFALAMPFMLGAILMGLEVANLTLAVQKVNQLSTLAADNAARVTRTIDETDIIEIMAATKLNGENVDFMKNGRIVISSVQANQARTGQWIRWQRCIGDRKTKISEYGVQGKGESDDSLAGIGKTNPKMTAPAGTAIIVAEVEYLYKPLVTDALFEEKVLKAQTAFIVRQRTDLGITNTTALPGTKILTC